MANINITISDELHKQLKIAAATEGTTLKDKIVTDLTRGVQRRGKRQ